MEHAHRILVVDDNPAVLELVAAVLEKYEVTKANSAADAVALISSKCYHVVVTEARLRDASGVEVLDAAKHQAFRTEVLFVARFASDADAAAALRMGAFDYLEKPFHPDDLCLAVARALESLRETPITTDVGVPLRMVVEAPGHTAPELARSTLDLLRKARARASTEFLNDLVRAFDGSVPRAAEYVRMEGTALSDVLARHGVPAGECDSDRVDPAD